MTKVFTLREIAPPVPAEIAPADSLVWLLNLDQIEPHSGRLLARQEVGRESVGASTYAFDGGNVLYSKLRPYLNKVYLPDGVGYCTSELVPMRPDLTKVTREFLAAYLRSPTFLGWVSQQIDGAKMPRVSMKAFWEHQVRLPSLEEQRFIATILGKTDNLLRKREETIKLADEFLRATFLDMFGCPVTNPLGWPLERFGDLGEWTSGGTPSRSNPEFFEGDIPWFSAGELNEMYISQSAERVTELALRSSAAKLFPAGSILLGMYDTAAFKTSILAVDASSNQACANFRPGALVAAEWFYYFVQIGKEHYLKHRRGVRQKNLNLGMIRAFELPCPPRRLQDEFSRIVGQVRKVLARQELSLKQVSELAAALQTVMLEGNVGRADRDWIRDEVAA